MAAATRERNAAQIAVHEAMSPRVLNCFAEDAVVSALKQMEEACVRRVPVVNHKGQLAGILSMDDIVVRALDEPGGISPIAFVNTIRRVCAKPAVEPNVASRRRQSE